MSGFAIKSSGPKLRDSDYLPPSRLNCVIMGIRAYCESDIYDNPTRYVLGIHSCQLLAVGAKVAGFMNQRRTRIPVNL